MAVKLHDVDIDVRGPYNVSVVVDGEPVVASGISFNMKPGESPRITIELPAVVRFRGRAEIEYEADEIDVEAVGGGEPEEVDKSLDDEPSVPVESTPNASKNRHPAGKRKS